MPDLYGSSSTDLGNPSMFGTQPAQSQRTEVYDGGLPERAIGTLTNALSEGIDTFRQAEMWKAQNAILGGVGQQQASINQAVVQGTMTPQEAHIRSSALYTSAIANYPMLAEQFGQQNSVFKASTVLGDVDAAVNNQRNEQQKMRDDEDNMAIGQGYYLDGSMSDAQRQVVINAAQNNVYSQKQLQIQQDQFNFQKDQTTFNQGQADRQAMFQSINLINNMAGHNFDAFDATMSNLASQVQSGKMTADQARAQLNTQYGNIAGTIQALAGKNPELAAPYRDLFQQKYQLGLQLLDPTKNQDDLNAQKQALITKQQLLMLSDPQDRSLVATSQLFGPNNPVLQMADASAIIKNMAASGAAGTQNGQTNGFVPQIVGSPQEPGVLTGLKSGIDMLRGGTAQDPATGNNQASNSVNVLLKQTGDYMNSGQADPTKLKGLADFFASPQYAYMVQHGQIDPVAAQTAKKTFQALYEPAVTAAVGTRLDTPLNSDPNKKFSDVVDANFTGAGVSFSLRKGLSPEDTAAAQAQVTQMNQATQGLNTLVRLGAHMEGTTDYQKYWNDNKYYLLPQSFPVKPDQVVNGYKWTGRGDWRDRNTWIQVGGSNNQ